MILLENMGDTNKADDNSEEYWRNKQGKWYFGEYGRNKQRNDTSGEYGRNRQKCYMREKKQGG